MNTIKIIFFTCSILLSFDIAAQQQVSIEEAQRAAVQTLNLQQRSEVTYNEAMVKKVNELKNRSNQTLMYEVMFDGQGVLLSGSKACLPVLGYFNPHCSFYPVSFCKSNLQSSVGSILSTTDFLGRKGAGFSFKAS